MFRHSTTQHDFPLREEEGSFSSLHFSASAVDCDPVEYESRPKPILVETRPANEKRRLRLRFGLLLVGFDVLAISIAILGATLIRFGADFAAELGQLMVIILPIYLMVAANGHAFRLGEAIHDNAPRGRGRALMAFLISIGLILGIVFYLKVSQNFSRGALALSLVSGLMALAFFGKGVGSLGWAVVADTAPREVVGLAGSIFNMFGNTAGIVTPIVIGYIVDTTGSFNLALVFVGLNALVTVVAYTVVVGKIRRIEFQDTLA